MPKPRTLSDLLPRINIRIESDVRKGVARKQSLAHKIQVDASGSSAAGTALIATYAWTWGDSTSTAASSSPVAQHTYVGPLSYQVTLTVTDTLGRVGTITQAVAVP